MRKLQFNHMLFKLKCKQEKGGVTLFILIAMLFFLGIGMSLYVSTMNSSTAQERDLKKIQSAYNNAGDLNKLYEKKAGS